MPDQPNENGDFSDKTISTEGSGSGGALSTLQNFDWLKLPGAARALATLITGTAEAGAAWIDVLKAKGEQQSRVIRDTTASRSRMLDHLTQAAIDKAMLDEDTVNRAMQYTLVRGIKEQRNREAIAAEAIEMIGAPSEDKVTLTPDDDWMDLFIGYANRANSERLQRHWASVLAGEIKAPGSFSFQTLHIMSMLDTSLAETITRVSEWVGDNESFIPMVKSLEMGANYSALVRLANIGMISMGHAKHYDLHPVARVITPVFGDKLVVARWPTAKRVMIKCALILEAGEQIFKLVGKTERDASFLEEFSETLKGLGASSVVIKPLTAA